MKRTSKSIIKRRDNPNPFGKGATGTPPASTDSMSPLFSLEDMRDGSGFSINCCDKDDQSALAKRLFYLSKLTWRQIRHSPRHGVGQEIIDRSSINAPIPDTVTEDVSFIALRFSGKRPMVGYRKGRVFHILWIDKDFSLYDH